MGTKFSDYVASVEAKASDAEAALLDAYSTHFEAERDRILGLPAALAAARARAGLTQKELSDLSEVQQSEISRIERGQGNPTMDTLSKIAAPLHAHLALVDDHGHILTA
jgi:DNA-binding XRE family transcriptional regulator